ncbi:hypothetical protein DMB95_04555 [Campylobacter sp. MIT 12-8780]|nr:hypothetical protein DMB95_04555 [Campylobacter sp. MIT 12-8780]
MKIGFLKKVKNLYKAVFDKIKFKNTASYRLKKEKIAKKSNLFFTSVLKFSFLFVFVILLIMKV